MQHLHEEKNPLSVSVGGMFPVHGLLQSINRVSGSVSRTQVGLSPHACPFGWEPLCGAQLVQPYAAAQALASRQWIWEGEKNLACRERCITRCTVPSHPRQGYGVSTLMPRAKVGAVGNGGRLGPAGNQEACGDHSPALCP